MVGKQEAEVLVVGAGPVGLFAALKLAIRGIRCQIVDREWRTGSHAYALALHRPALKLLQQAGLLDRIMATALPIERVALYDQTARRAELTLGHAGESLPGLVVMSQAAFEQILEEALQQYGVSVQWNHAVSQVVSHEDRVTVTVDKMVKESLGYAVAHSEWLVAKTTELEVPFVIGADGHRSRVRREVGIDFPEVGPKQHFAVFEFQTDADLQNKLHLVVANGTSNVVWPLPGGFCRWSFELPEFTAALEARQKARVSVQLGGAEYPVLEEAQLRKLLAERAPWFQASVGQINWRMIVRFERRLASAFGRQRVWLAGDSGHVTGPAGVQSMNVGLREAQDLVAILTGILRDGQPLAQLEQYNRDRLTEWRALLGLEGGLHATDATDPWLREHLARILPCLPASGPDLVALGQQLGCHV